MIEALVIAVSVPGVWVAWRLLRPMPLLAREVALVDDEPEVRFGFDHRGLVD